MSTAIQFSDELPRRKLSVSADAVPAFVFDVGNQKITVSVELVTPEMAKAWLANRNLKFQRNRRPRTIKKIASDLRSGRYNFNAQPAIFDNQGRNVDGQNRFEAIVETGISAPMLIVRGVDPSAFMTMDSGESRPLKDVVKGLGYASPREVASVATLIWRYQTGNLLGADMPSNPHVAELMESHPGIADSVSRSWKCKEIVRSSAIAGFFHYVFSDNDRDLAEIFFDRLSSGEELKKNDPILTLRRWLLSYDKPDRRVLTFVYMIKAWNAFKSRRHLSLLRWSIAESFPEIS